MKLKEKGKIQNWSQVPCDGGSSGVDMIRVVEGVRVVGAAVVAT